MYSFAIHNISPDTAHTNWDSPVTERDRIRVAYKSNNRGYHIRDTIIYPTAHDIVKPLVEGPGNVVEWWKDASKPGREEDGDELLAEFLEEGSWSREDDDPNSDKGKEENIEDQKEKKLK